MGNIITVGTTGADYTTFADAVAAASAGDTIRLLTDMSNAENAYFNGLELTLDLNGFTMSGNVYAGNYSGALEHTSLIIQGGTMAGYICAGNGYADMVSSSSVTITGGVYNNAVYGAGDSWADTTATSITIEGGTFTNGIYGGGYNSGLTASTEINFSGGSANAVYGGNWFTANVGSSSITVTNGSIGEVFGGGNVGGLDGASNISISGGSIGSVYGGAVGADTVVNSVNITVSGGTVSNLYGCGYQGKVSGDVYISISGSASIGYMVMGSWFSSVAALQGAGTLEITGDNVLLGSTVSGAYFSVDAEGNTITKYADLVITDASGGNYVGKIANFNSLTIKGNSSLSSNFAVTYDFGGAVIFDLTGRTENTTAMAADNSFIGNAASLAIKITDAQLEGNDSYLITSGIDWSGFDLSSITVNGKNQSEYTNCFIDYDSSAQELYLRVHSTPSVITVGTAGADFDTFAGAAGAAVNGDTVKMITDMSNAENAVFDRKNIILDLSGNTMSGNIYAGISDGNAASTNLTITDSGSGGTVLGSVFAGNVSGGVVTDSKLTIQGGTFNGRIYGTGDAWASSVNTHLIIDGGVFTGGANGGIYGGGYNTSGISAVNIQINGGSAENVFGGNWFSANVGSVDITMTGGTVNDLYGGGNVGGADGAVNIAVSGGTISSLYGSGAGADSLVKSVNINISGGSISNLYGGGYQGKVANDVLLTISGAAVLDNVRFGNWFISDGSIGGTAAMVIQGNEAVINSTVSGSYVDLSGTEKFGSLELNNVSGSGYNEKFANFDKLVISGDSRIDAGFSVMYNYGGKLEFNLNERSSNPAAFISGNDFFAGYTTGINIVISAETLAAGGTYHLTEWTDFSAETIAQITVNGSAELPAGWKIKQDYASGSLFFTSGENIISGGSYESFEGSAISDNSAWSVLSSATVSGNVYGGGKTPLSGVIGLEINNGDYHQIFGGSLVNSDLGEASADQVISVSFAGGSVTRIIGGHAAAGGTAAYASGNVSITGRIEGKNSSGSAWSYAGGIAAENGVLNVQNAAVKSDANDYAGSIAAAGRVENSGVISVADASVEHISGSADTIVGGTYINRGGSGTVDAVSVNVGSSASAATVFGGGLIAGDGNLTLGECKVNVDGIISNAVFGGSYLTGGSASQASAVLTLSSGAANGVYGGGFVAGGNENIESASITLSAGNFDGCIFGGAYATGGEATVNNVVISVAGSANVTGNIYAGGFANGGTVTVNNARIEFNTLGIFSGSVIASGYGNNAISGTVELAFNACSGEFSGKLADQFSSIEISADSTLTFANEIAANLTESGLLNVIDNGGETSSHDVFDLADSAFDISGIQVNGTSLVELGDWSSLEYAYAYQASDCRFAVVMAADKETYAASGYSFYTLA